MKLISTSPRSDELTPSKSILTPSRLYCCKASRILEKKADFVLSLVRIVCISEPLKFTAVNINLTPF